MSQFFSIRHLLRFEVVLAGFMFLLLLCPSSLAGDLFLRIPERKGGATTHGFKDLHEANFFYFSLHSNVTSGSNSAPAFSLEVGLKAHHTFALLIQDTFRGKVFTDMEFLNTQTFLGVNKATESYRFKSAVFSSFNTFITEADEPASGYVSIVPLDDIVVTYTEYDPGGTQLNKSMFTLPIDPAAQAAFLATVPEPSTAMLGLLSLVTFCSRRRRARD